MSKKLFGTDGVRGRANVYPLTADFAMKLGQAAGILVANNKKKVAIGKDTRISGDMLEGALIAGFNSVGVDVIRLGIIPTPAVTMLTSGLDVDMSIIISASHNPYYDNGIKLKNGDGDKLSADLTSKIEDFVINGTVDLNPNAIGKVIDNEGAIEGYKNVYEEFRSLNGLKVVIDCANGAFSAIAPEVLRKLGADVIAIGNQPNGVNINKDCGSTSTDLMCKTVVEKGADIGISLDGDGDRIVVSDEKGNRINCDQLIAFLASYFKSENKLTGNAIITTEFSNLGIGEYAKSIGLEYHATKVGEHYVIEKMREINCNVGGEESGHIVLSDCSVSGDGLAVGVVLCEALLKSGKKMSENFPVFEPFPIALEYIYFDTKEQAAASVDNDAAQEIISEVREILKDGKLIVRKSGTEARIMLNIQHKDANVVEKARVILKELVEKGK